MRLLQKKHQLNPFKTKYKCDRRPSVLKKQGAVIKWENRRFFSLKKKKTKNYYLDIWKKIKTRNIIYSVSNIKIVKQNTIKKNKKYVQHSGTEPGHKSTIALTNELRGL